MQKRVFYLTVCITIPGIIKILFERSHSKSAILVPKWIAFQPTIPFLHGIADPICNPFCNPHYYVHWWIQLGRWVGGNWLNPVPKTRPEMCHPLSNKSWTHPPPPLLGSLASPIVRTESSALNPHAHPRATPMSGQSRTK